MKSQCVSLCLGLLWVLFPGNIHAQQFSAWSTDPKVTTLKARYASSKTSENWNEIMLQVTSSVGCTLLITSSLCSTDPLGKNGWQSLRIQRGEIKTVYIKASRNCMNGWWWWYKNYKTTAVRID